MLEGVTLRQDANQGLKTVYYITMVTIVVLIVLGAVLWWYDGYWLHKG